MIKYKFIFCLFGRKSGKFLRSVTGYIITDRLSTARIRAHDQIFKRYWSNKRVTLGDLEVYPVEPYYPAYGEETGQVFEVVEKS
jgi:hypothetical protein